MVNLDEAGINVWFEWKMLSDDGLVKDAVYDDINGNGKQTFGVRYKCKEDAWDDFIYYKKIGCEFPNGIFLQKYYD